MTDPTIYAVIMAGGSGTRFWPASRRLRPKQLLPLGGPQPLLRETVDRVLPLCGKERIYIATGRHLAAPTRAVLPELAPQQLLIEPVARNTAPCIGWAAAVVARRDPDAVIMALPSDPHIRDEQRFREILKQACEAAAGGTITTIGIQPTRPETGYGYIEAVAGTGPVRQVARFVEKPDLPRAQAFVDSGRFFWNAGMFFFRAKDMLAAIDTHLPALAAALRKLDQAAAVGKETHIIDDVFDAMPAISIDHGIMEKITGIKMVVGDFGWSDLGSWLAVSDLAAALDGQGNHAPAGSVLVGSKRCHVFDHTDQTQKKLVALVGVEDLVVVDTDDALLIVHRDAAQRVREVVAALKARGEHEKV